MEKQEMVEAVACLQQDPIKFHYFKDRYALMLLSSLVGEGRKIKELKSTEWSKLLSKPPVKEVLQNAGSQILTSSMLDAFWPQDGHCYLLTLGTWGGRQASYQQTSRPGWNLVIQLNFSSRHNRPYERLVKPGQRHPFHPFSHPVSKEAGMHTLAWARIDLDLEEGEALIEEIQNDWIRLALKSRQLFSNYRGCETRYKPAYIREVGSDLTSLTSYVDTVLQPHIDIWQEAMLMGALWYIKNEIGIQDIFYHTFDFGCRLKAINGRRPPRSLYTRLPEQFCFQKTERRPSFLLKKNTRKASAVLKEEGQYFYCLRL